MVLVFYMSTYVALHVRLQENLWNNFQVIERAHVFKISQGW